MGVDFLFILILALILLAIVVSCDELAVGYKAIIDGSAVLARPFLHQRGLLM